MVLSINCHSDGYGESPVINGRLFTSDPIAFIKEMHIPLTFAGLDTLLFGVRRHLQLLHITILGMNEISKVQVNGFEKD